MLGTLVGFQTDTWGLNNNCLIAMSHLTLPLFFNFTFQKVGAKFRPGHCQRIVGQKFGAIFEEAELVELAVREVEALGVDRALVLAAEHVGYVRDDAVGVAPISVRVVPKATIYKEKRRRTALFFNIIYTS